MTLHQDAYGKRTLDFIEDVQKLQSLSQICDRIVEELEWFGFEFLSVADIPGPGMPVYDGMLFNNRPLDYMEHYARKDYIRKDPVILALRQDLSPFAWDDVRQRCRSTAARRIIDEGRDFGATDGLMIPIHTASGRLSIFSTCGGCPNLSPRARAAVEMIGIYSHQALQRAAARERRSGQALMPLTVREREVLTWVAAGKSDDEIGMILGIGRETVTGHVENAKRKLDATKRIYAVIQALRSGEINL